MQQNRNIKEIKVNKLLTGVSEALILSFFNPENFASLKEGEIIYQSGDESKYLYFLLRGDVKIKYPRANYVSNKDFNDFFGEKEIVDETRRISSAVANSNCLLYKLEKNLFRKLISKNPTLNSNLENYGEIHLPKIGSEVKPTFNFNGASKPVSFRATNKAVVNEWDDKIKTENPAELTPEPPVAGITKEPEETPSEVQEESTEEKIEFAPNSGETELQETNDLDIDSDNIDIKFAADDTDFKNEKGDTTLNIEDLPEQDIESIEQEVFEEEKKDNDLIDREQLRKVFGCIDGINSGMKLLDAVKAIKKSAADLTQSESAELLLVDEKISEMQKLIEKDDSYTVESFVLPEGLAGNCALQKKIINYDRPTDDSRFVAKIDQPGSARLKSIIYFPVINEGGDTIAVLVLSRESKKYTEDEITYITMVSKQIERAIVRATDVEELLKQDRLSLSTRLEKFILNDIKSPLIIINNYTELLSQKNLPEDVDEVIRMLQKQAHSIEDLASSIISCASNCSEAKTNKIHFNELFHDLLELLSEYCEMREVKLFKRIGDGTVVTIDRSKFYTAVFQVIKNACDVSKEGGVVYLSTELTDRWMILNIRDEGPGIPEEIQDKIFESFFTEGNEAGEGLGLLLAKNIMEAHKGKISFESSAEGTTFILSLPVNNDSEEP
ncbi:MAG: cyclic nucleotide-binding domain-containing protein [Ignavibacteria bacterium]|nr:cyclic nucleotide-binding domain-containing protein [Ignavibacteria bacterium]